MSILNENLEPILNIGDRTLVVILDSCGIYTDKLPLSIADSIRSQIICDSKHIRTAIEKALGGEYTIILQYTHVGWLKCGENMYIPPHTIVSCTVQYMWSSQLSIGEFSSRLINTNIAIVGEQVNTTKWDTTRNFTELNILSLYGRNYEETTEADILSRFGFKTAGDAIRAFVRGAIGMAYSQAHLVECREN